MADKYKKAVIPGKNITLYAGKKRVASALEALSELDLYKGAKKIDLIETAYEQGKKDGAAKVIAEFDEIARRIPHKNPGRPSKHKKMKARVCGKIPPNKALHWRRDLVPKHGCVHSSRPSQRGRSK